MALILGLESATVSGSVALVRDGQMLGVHHYHLDRSHSSLLHKSVDQLFQNCQVDWSSIDAVALSEGPGSYTGLRIGCSAAKGFCLAQDKPLIAVNTLLSMAFQVHKAQTEPVFYCPMIDARRMEVYAMMLDPELNVVMRTEPVILDPGSFSEVLAKQKVIFFGDGASKFEEIANSPRAVFVHGVLPSALDIALLGEKKFEKGAFENLIDFEPFYLKEFRLTTKG